MLFRSVHTAFEKYSDYNLKRIIVYKALTKPLDKATIEKIWNKEISHVFIYSKRGAQAFLGNFPKHFNFKNFIHFSSLLLILTQHLIHHSLTLPISRTKQTIFNHHPHNHLPRIHSNYRIFSSAFIILSRIIFINVS